MAMIDCKECGGRISSKANKCPHCGCDANIARRARRGCIRSVANFCFAVLVIAAAIYLLFVLW